MSTSNRIGRNPFDKKPSTSLKAAKPSENPGTSKSKKVLKTSDKKTEAATAFSAPDLATAQISMFESAAAIHSAIVEEQIIGELIDLPEENWQPLTMVPAQFIRQVISRWI